MDSLHTSIEFGQAKPDDDRAEVAGGWNADPGAWPNGSDLEHLPPPDDVLPAEPSKDMTAPPFEHAISDRPAPETEEKAAASVTNATASSEGFPEPSGPAPGILAENGASDAASTLDDAHTGQEPADSAAAQPDTSKDLAHGGSVSEQPSPEVQAAMFNGGPARAANVTDSEAVKSPPHAENGRQLLRITFSRSGQFSRDKYRLREIFDAVRDPKGRDQFVVVLETNGSRHQLTFPNEYCNVSARLLKDLRNHFKVEVAVEDQP